MFLYQLHDFSGQEAIQLDQNESYWAAFLAVGANVAVPYVLSDMDGRNWERGTGAFDGFGRFRRDVVTQSSVSGNAKVSFNFARRVLAVLAAPPATGGGSLSGSVAYNGVISPTAITGTVHNWNPTDLSTTARIRVATVDGGGATLTGLAGGADGRIMVLHNIQNAWLSLTNEDAGSTAANRFLAGAWSEGSVTLRIAPFGTVTLQYDSTSLRWRVTGATGHGFDKMTLNPVGAIANGATLAINAIDASAGNLQPAIRISSTTVLRGWDFRMNGGTLWLDRIDNETPSATAQRYGFGSGGQILFGAVGVSTPALRGTSFNTGPYLSVNTATGETGFTVDSFGVFSVNETSIANRFKQFHWDAETSPSSFGADQNNLDLGNNVVARIAGSAARNITGIARGATAYTGRVLVLCNVGTFNLTLVNESASSTAANRFVFGADFVLAAGASITLIYDGASQRWRPANPLPASGPVVVNRNSTLVTITSSITETSLYSVSVNGPTFLNNKITNFKARGYVFNNDGGGPKTVRWRLKFNGTTIWDATYTIQNNFGLFHPWKFEIDLQDTGTAQIATGDLEIGITHAAATTGQGNWDDGASSAYYYSGVRGTAAVTTSGNHTIELTAQLGYSSAQFSLIKNMGLIVSN